MDKKLYEAYIKILEEELVPAMGCTEPIAIAYGAALARETLGSLPQKVIISASGNIIKNVKSVVVPNTGGLRGNSCRSSSGSCGRKGREKAGSTGRYYFKGSRRDQRLSEGGSF